MTSIEELRALADKGMTTAEIAKETGMPSDKVRENLRNYKRMRGCRRGKSINGERDAEIKRLRCEELLTLQEIADRFGISRERVRQITKDWDRDVPDKARQKRYDEILAVPLYKPLRQVMKITGYSATTIYGAYKSAGITLAQRRRAAFFHNVEEDECGCHMWTGYLHPVTGYGVFSYRAGGKDDRYAHRLAWMFAGNEIPRGMHVLHTCDNPACVNVDHLFLGTHQDNMADRDAKGRQAKGERSGVSKLTRREVETARNLMYEHPDWSMTDLIQHMNVGVGTQALYNAVTGRTWGHVPAALGNLR